VPRERATSANARHECFVMDASVSVRTAETAEMDELRQPCVKRARTTVLPWGRRRPWRVAWDCRCLSRASAAAVLGERSLCTVKERCEWGGRSEEDCFYARQNSVSICGGLVSVCRTVQ
jgi:hypothetical protein